MSRRRKGLLAMTSLLALVLWLPLASLALACEIPVIFGLEWSRLPYAVLIYWWEYGDNALVQYWLPRDLAGAAILLALLPLWAMLMPLKPRLAPSRPGSGQPPEPVRAHSSLHDDADWATVREMRRMFPARPSFWRRMLGR